MGLQISKDICIYIKSAKISLNTFFVSAFLIYLCLVEQKSDIVIGIPVLNRSGATEKSIVGMFTSTMPLRMNINTDSTVNDFLESTNHEVMKCLFNQKYPYELLLQDLKIRQKGYDHLFDLCVNYYNTKLAVQMNGVPIENIEFFNGNLIYSMQLIVKEWSETGRLTLDFDYRTSDYTDNRIHDIFNCLSNIIRQIVNNDKKKIMDIQVVTEQQIQQQVYQFNSTACEYPGNKTVYGLFDEQVERSPDRTAILHENECLTYRELQRKANSLANYLIIKGIEEEKIVGLIAEHSIETVIGILGILKAGGAYLPIDPEYPADRIKHMLEECKVNTVVTNCTIDIVPGFPGDIIDLRNTDVFKMDGNEPEYVNKPNDLAYVIYTSGSTGEPKGVMVEHRGLTNYTWWASKTYVKDQVEAFPLYTPLSFDLTVTSLFVPLISGGSIIVYDNKKAEFALHRVFNDNKASVIKLTPSHLMLIKDMENSRSSIKKLIIGGEDLKTDLARSVYDSFGGNVEIYNEYGPTETVVGCMIHKFDAEVDKNASVPIGKPIDNTQIYILDKNLRPLPAGYTGEIYISGDCVARGYIGKQKMTEERFMDNPFRKGKRMYKTGDMARFNENGRIVYTGRADRQLKIRGYRIEPAEAERHLLNYEGVQNAVVAGGKHANGDKYLCAYIAAAMDIDENKIKDYLKHYLPVHAIPERYVFLDALPLTPNGKIDYNLLPESAYKINNEYVKPRNQTEDILVKLLAGLLSIDAVGVKDNFYRLGGDSIKAIQLSSRLNSIGYTLKVKDILLNPTIEEMAAHIESIDSIQEDKQRILEGNIEPLPITAWFFSQKLYNPDYYNQSVLLDLYADMDKAKLDGIFRALIEHHDSLRINCSPRIGELFYNNNHLMNSFDVNVYHLSDDHKDNREDVIRYVCKTLSSEFDIEKGLLIKVCLFDLGSRQKKLFITVHHLVIDSISWRVLIEDISTAIECVLNKKEILLPKKTLSYQEWSKLINAQVNTVSIKNQKSYWNTIVRKSFLFPMDDKPLSICTLNHCTSISVKLPVEKTGQLLRGATAMSNIKAGELLLVALVITMMEHVKNTEVVVEVESHGRSGPDDSVDLSRTVGWFTSIYPVHFQLQAYDDLDAAIKSLKEQIRGVPDNGMGYGILKYLMNEIDDKQENSRIRFNYIGDLSDIATGNYVRLSENKLTADSDANNHMSCLIDIIAAIIDKELNVSFTYSRDVFNDDTCSRFLKHFRRNIIRIIDHCRNRTEVVYTPSDFDMVELSQDELDMLLK